MIQESAAPQLANLTVNVVGVSILLLTAAMLERRAEVRLPAVAPTPIRATKGLSSAI